MHSHVIELFIVFVNISQNPYWNEREISKPLHICTSCRCCRLSKYSVQVCLFFSPVTSHKPFYISTTHAHRILDKTCKHVICESSQTPPSCLANNNRQTNKKHLTLKTKQDKLNECSIHCTHEYYSQDPQVVHTLARYIRTSVQVVLGDAPVSSVCM